ncbi:MAG: hypothetical protein L0209_02455, partial [candidate division Zixibacteria bacterium]|nr:hypothetical protein [candidate division Zixibacteria bacterium]
MLKRWYIALIVLLPLTSMVLAQAPDPRDWVFIESKTVLAGISGSGVLLLKVEIANKDTLANFTLPLEIKTVVGTGFIVLGYPRTFAGTMNRLTSTLGNNLTFSPFLNNASPDSAVWSAFWDPNDTTTAEPPNSFRKPFWELRFDSIKAAEGDVFIDSAVIFDNRAGFVSIGGNSIGVNFSRGNVYVAVHHCEIFNCSAGGNVLFGRGYTYDFDASEPGTWSVTVGPGNINASTGVYNLGGQCALGQIEVVVRLTTSLGTFCECYFMLNIIDSPPSCSPAQNTVAVSHGQTATNQINATDPNAGDGFVFSKLSGPGAVNSSGGWSYSTSCSDVGASPQTIQIKTSDAFGSCIPGPGSCTSEFQLVVTNAAPSITNCPTDVLPTDTGVAFSLQLSGTDIDPADSGNLLWFLVSAPAGLTVS